MRGSIPEWEQFLASSPVETSPSQLLSSFSGKNIAITGAGGFIGSELVKALATVKPRSLVLLDSFEGNLFNSQQYMDRTHPAVFCQAVLGSIEDEALLDDAFRRSTPDVIFHAAAFKHVALLERNPFAAVKNNILGTYTLVKAAIRQGASRLILISTDKAVNPHSVMGVSKRIAELMTVAFSGPVSRMNAIRLVNVIGSSGSVVPIFQEQINQGQPLTVTHLEASRYFLSGAEAVQAILAAGIAECEGRVLLPKLSEPIRIVELARFLGGNTPLQFIGLRPGEKLREDLIASCERIAGTIENSLTVIQTQKLSTTEIGEAVQRLTTCVAGHNTSELLEILLTLVPEYEPSQLILEGAASFTRR